MTYAALISIGISIAGLTLGMVVMTVASFIYDIFEED